MTVTQMTPDQLCEDLLKATRALDNPETEVSLDFCSVRRIDSAAVRALEELAGSAQHKGIKVVLHGVNIDVYKVLKLVKLARHFSFVNEQLASGDGSGERNAEPATE